MQEILNIFIPTLFVDRALRLLHFAAQNS